MRRVFFSFHYQRDIWRVNQIRHLDTIQGCAAAGFADASLWESRKLSGDSAVRRLIDDGLKGTTVTVVCIGSLTAGRRFVDFEINRSIERGNGVIGLHIHHLRDQRGASGPCGVVPWRLIGGGCRIYHYTGGSDLRTWIEQAARAAGHPPTLRGLLDVL